MTNGVYDTLAVLLIGIVVGAVLAYIFMNKGWNAAAKLMYETKENLPPGERFEPIEQESVFEEEIP